MPKAYLLRNIPETLWRGVKARAAVQGESVRALILRALQAAVSTPSAQSEDSQTTERMTDHA